MADDYTSLLPSLDITFLRALTGYNRLGMTDDILLDVSAHELDPVISQRHLRAPDASRVALDNQLNWFSAPKEMVAYLRYRRGAKTRDLVFIRPEGIEPFLALARVTPEARKLGIVSHSQQVIGYVMLDREDAPNGRGCVVLDTYLGDSPPIDEEDLLDPRGLR